MQQAGKLIMLNRPSEYHELTSEEVAQAEVIMSLDGRVFKGGEMCPHLFWRRQRWWPPRSKGPPVIYWRITECATCRRSKRHSG